jgi:hypothetical protein
MKAKMAGQMQSSITVLRPVAPSFDAASGLITAHSNTTTVWTGPARVYTASGGGNTQIGDGYLTLRTTTISVMEVGSDVIQVNDLVKITSDADDAAATNKQFRVIDVTLGGVLDPTRKLTCTEVEANPFHPQS